MSVLPVRRHRGLDETGDTPSLPRQIVQARFRRPTNANTNHDVTREGVLLHVLPIEPDKRQTRVEVVLNGIQ